jgi:putative acetyltransferase
MVDGYPIRAAVPEDAPLIHGLYGRSVRALCARHYDAGVIDGWLAPRSPRGYLRGIETGEVFVAHCGTEVVAFGAAVPGAIGAVYVEPRLTGRGIGSLVLNHAIGLATRIPCSEVSLKSTLNAVTFYSHHGFVEVDRGTFRMGAVDVPIVSMVRKMF